MCLTAVKNHKTIVMEVDTAFSTATLSVLLAHLTAVLAGADWVMPSRCMDISWNNSSHKLLQLWHLWWSANLKSLAVVQNVSNCNLAGEA